MKSGQMRIQQTFFLPLFAVSVAFLCFPAAGLAQGSGLERSFPQSKAAVEQALKTMQSASAGRLPVLDGFATPADHPLDRYQRGYYQSKIVVSSTPSGGSIVRVSAQVTAWYNDPSGAHSGYQVLPSNGRLEGDLLDQLGDQLASRTEQAAPTTARTPAPAATDSVPAATAPNPVARAPRAISPAATYATTPPAAATTAKATPPATANPNEPALSAPMPRIPDAGGGILSSLSKSLADQEKAGPESAKNKQDQNNLQAEADSLEEVLKNQAHPKNLVAVRKSGTPVVATASLNAKTLFLASAHDEFEMLDFNQDWVHVRVSGISRGWIWRNNLEMPDSIPDADLPSNPSATPVAAELYHVTREEKAQFPGDWAPLRGKLVNIVSVEKINESQQDSGPQLRLEFAKSLLDKDYAGLAQRAQELSGIVLIFDSSDGGMIAATLPVLQRWKAGTLSDAALWHECFFDPPESFIASGGAGSE
jgi:hypothetical protein